MECNDDRVDYESFGARGDGIADDLPAICQAHDYANTNDVPVRSRPEATYHLGRQALTAVIATDTDWNTSRFTIDDTDVDDHKKPLFVVQSRLDPEELPIEKLARNQTQLDVQPQHDCFVTVTDDSRRVYIRRGLNRNNGVPRHDSFILRRDGSIEAPVNWEFEQVSKVVALPMDDTPLTVRGGVFNTIANCMQQEKGYNYWARNIEIQRSNTTVDGLVHYVVGETETGHPYRGFLSARSCANVTYKDCFVTPHKIYQTIGAANRPVSMGSYDLHANSVVNFRLLGCRMNHVTDHTRWGIIGSNFCKNILLEDCALSRMDTHMGVNGGYTIRRCTLGWMGLNAIGCGELLIEDSTLHGSTLINFRGDYGSTWQGDVTIRKTQWIPACGDTCWPHLLGTHNDSTHDFGYPCSMPWIVNIDGLTIDDSNHPEDYTGPYVFTDPNAGWDDDPAADEQLHPYQPCRNVTVRNLTIASGKPLQLCPAELPTELVLE